MNSQKTRLTQILEEEDKLKKEKSTIKKDIILKSGFISGDKICFKQFPEIKAYIKKIECTDKGELFTSLFLAKKDGSQSLISYNILNSSEGNLKSLKKQSNFAMETTFYIEDIIKLEEEIVEKIVKKRNTVKKTSYYYSVNYCGTNAVVKAFSIKDIKDKLRVSNDYISKICDTLYTEKEYDIDLTLDDTNVNYRQLLLKK